MESDNISRRDLVWLCDRRYDSTAVRITDGYTLVCQQLEIFRQQRLMRWIIEEDENDIDGDIRNNPRNNICTPYLVQVRS